MIPKEMMMTGRTTSFPTRWSSSPASFSSSRSGPMPGTLLSGWIGQPSEHLKGRSKSLCDSVCQQNLCKRGKEHFSLYIYIRSKAPRSKKAFIQPPTPFLGPACTCTCTQLEKEKRETKQYFSRAFALKTVLLSLEENSVTIAVSRWWQKRARATPKVVPEVWNFTDIYISSKISLN